MVDFYAPAAQTYEPLAVVDSIRELPPHLNRSRETAESRNYECGEQGDEFRDSRFSDNLFSCFSNLFPSCFCAFFCWDGIYLVAQSERKKCLVYLWWPQSFWSIMLYLKINSGRKNGVLAIQEYHAAILDTSSLWQRSVSSSIRNATGALCMGSGHNAEASCCTTREDKVACTMRMYGMYLRVLQLQLL